MKNRAPVSVVISAYNEERKIGDCLESVKWADEVIVIDNESTDDTRKIVSKYTKNIFTRPNNPMLNVNKNFGFTKASHEWILSLDADERVTDELAEEVKNVITVDEENSRFRANNIRINGYWIPRKNIIFGKWIKNDMWWPDEQLRLFRKGRGKFPEEHVHEKVAIQGETAKLQQSMLHLNYETVSQYIRKMDSIYTENEVNTILGTGRELQWSDAIRMPVSDFLKTFFLQKGYKDGLHGLVLSLLQAFYAEIVFAKVWEKKGFPEYNNDNFIHHAIDELSRAAYEFNYWILTVLIDTSKDTLKKVYYTILRKRVNRRIKK